MTSTDHLPGPDGRYPTQGVIRNHKLFEESLRCFDWLGGVVPGAMDVDLLLERAGNFLVLELKPRIGPRVYVPLGQYIALKALAAREGFTVLLVVETPESKKSPLPLFSVANLGALPKGGVRRWQGVKSMSWELDSNFEDMTLDDLRARLRTWWNEAAA
jgi:hypothetical protein